MTKKRILWMLPLIMYIVVYIYTVGARYLNEFFKWEYEACFNICLLALVLITIGSNIFLGYYSWKINTKIKASILYLIATLMLSIFWVFIGSMTISQTFL